MNLRIFTDGACSGNPGPGGWAIVANECEECKVITGGEEVTTNNRMELTAAINAVDYALMVSDSFGDRYTSIEIISDSAYVVNAINKAWLFNWQKNNWKTVAKTDVLNKDLWQKMYTKYCLCADKVKFVKVKGHSGNSFNEMADKEARKACKRMQDR